MAKLFVRIAGALGITALALFFVSVIPFFADPIVGAGFAAKSPSFSVNREFKGDRLPASSIATVASRSRPQNGPNTRDLGTRDLGARDLGGQDQAQKPRRIPVGCEGAFSPISSPRLAHILGRCMT
ncbi:MAG TPA: hypothetical protein VK653_01040 [Xanthobacteraceae bacterium]|nr:hypothetical protein [Xanthobacteraceae bacterium]